MAAVLILGLLGACRSFPLLMHAFREIFWCGDSGAGARLVHLSAEQSSGMLWAIFCDMVRVCGWFHGAGLSRALEQTLCGDTICGTYGTEPSFDDDNRPPNGDALGRCELIFNARSLVKYFSRRLFKLWSVPTGLDGQRCTPLQCTFPTR